VVDAAVLFVDFSDVPADRTPEDVLAILSPGAEGRYDSMSYGRMQLVLHPYPAWLRLAGDSAYYADAIRSSEGHRAFLQEAMDLADGAVDFSGMEVVVVMSAPNASAIGYGPAFVGYPGGGLVADGVEITNGITSGADLLYWGAPWLNHEMGHSMSLADLYSFAEPTGFTRPFSLMDQIDSEAPEYFAYERWLLGWIDDDQIVCQTWAEGEDTLTAVEITGGTKAVMLPIGTSRAVVVESRRAVGYDAALSRVGAVVYVVDTSIPSGSGPIQVMNDRQALLPGESITVEGVTVTVIAADELGDTVRTVVG
jgi:M6 family metalloprotease-like protein